MTETNMLEYRVAGEDRVAAGGPVAVLLHGRGADETDMVSLMSNLPKTWVVVTPRAPFSGTPWGYGLGWAWYRYLGRNRPEPESFERSLRAVSELLAALPSRLGVEPERIVLGGFSQGGSVSLAFALATAGGHLGKDAPRVGRIVNLSGFLADHPFVRAQPDTVDGTRFFWAHGTADPSIPFPLAVEGRAALASAGADLEARDYAMGHWIDPRELADLVAWVGGDRTGSPAP
jgi:phospholipase/carboxylesterase